MSPLHTIFPTILRIHLRYPHRHTTGSPGSDKCSWLWRGSPKTLHLHPQTACVYHALKNIHAWSAALYCHALHETDLERIRCRERLTNRRYRRRRFVRVFLVTRDAIAGDPRSIEQPFAFNPEFSMTMSTQRRLHRPSQLCAHIVHHRCQLVWRCLSPQQ